MAINIVPYEEIHINAVKDFNKRISQKKDTSKFPESNIPHWLPQKEGLNIYQKFYLAIENSVVRGAYIIKYQDFYINGEKIKVGCLQLPISEGIVDKKYSFLGVQLIRDALEKEPLLYALGIGGYNESYAKILLKLKWNNFLTPFHFRVINPENFFKNISFLRNKLIYKLILNISAYTLLPGLLLKLFQKIKSKKNTNYKNILFERVDEFGNWSNEIWNSVKDKFSMIAERNSDILNFLYPKEKEKFIKLKISNDSQTIGWVVLLITQVKNHKHFGNMLLGSIVDNLSLQGFENEVIFTATEYLTKSKVDLIVTNQSHINWVNALNNSGYSSGPSNYIFFSSPKLEKLLNPLQSQKNFTFFNRGDGDGPITL